MVLGNKPVKVIHMKNDERFLKQILCGKVKQSSP